MLGEMFSNLVSSESVAVIRLAGDEFSIEYIQGFSSSTFSNQLISTVAAEVSRLGGVAGNSFRCDELKVYYVGKFFPDNYIVLAIPFIDFEVLDANRILFTYAIVAAAERAINLLDSVSERVRIENELGAALAIHSTLLPKVDEIPGFKFSSHYLSASRLGGDWFGHYYDANNGRYYMLIGDVTGHGLGSALIAGLACGAAMTAIKQVSGGNADKVLSAQESLLEIAKCLNHVIFTTGRDVDRLMTMLFCCVDTKRSELSLINCGHAYPLIVRRGEEAKCFDLKV